MRPEMSEEQQSCQPSRISRDSPGIRYLVPVSRQDPIMSRNFVDPVTRGARVEITCTKYNAHAYTRSSVVAYQQLPAMSQSHSESEIGGTLSMTTTTASCSQQCLDEAASSSSIFSLSIPAPPNKKTKRASKWQKEWEKYNMKQSKRGASFVYCNVCCTDFSVTSGGVHDVKRHIGTKRHTEKSVQQTLQ